MRSSTTFRGDPEKLVLPATGFRQEAGNSGFYGYYWTYKMPVMADNFLNEIR